MRYCLLLVVFPLFLSCKNDKERSDFEKVSEQLPEMGPFMYRSESLDSVANWLGRPAEDGREILEPINMIFVDDQSTSMEASRARIYDIFSNAGFRARFGHSSDYVGWMNNTFYTQTPTESETAFSDFMWVFTNNHARVFGPYKSDDYWIWIASSSQEKGTIHDYVSFSKSRDKMAENMVKLSGCVLLGSIPLNNLINTPTSQTGDHDGFATVIKLK
jgi:hypothetical protein